MTDHRARPANDDLMKGWEACLKILPIIRPRLILVAGSDWRKVSTFKTTLSRHGGTIIMEACSEAISNAYGKHLLATTNDKSEFSLVFSMHPSGRNYSWKKWCPFVFKCAPELNAFVQKCRCAPAA
jgi:uracil-DNA glycosylase